MNLKLHKAYFFNLIFLKNKHSANNELSSPELSWLNQLTSSGSPNMNRKYIALSVLALLMSPFNVHAEKTEENSNEHKAGYDKKPDFGGPDSPQGQLEEDDRIKSSAFRFPVFDEMFVGWSQYKKELDQRIGLRFGGHYSMMYQNNGDDSGWAGNLRLNAQWTLVGRGTDTPGYISFLADNRHSIGNDGAPGTFGKFGQYGISAVHYGDFDGNFKILTMAWNQKLTDSTGYIIGSYDPNDYISVQGYVNPQTTFSNINILLETSQALSDTSWGVAGGHWFNDSWYVQGGINDANGYGGDGNEWFVDGSEFFKWAHLGWSPSKGERYFKNVHIAAWHTDERTSYGPNGQEAVWGASAGLNWTFNQVFMPFVKAGFSEGDHDFFNNTVAVGMLYQSTPNSDLFGIAGHWGRFSNNHSNGLGGESQFTSEVFYRYQLSQNLAITPSLQFIDNPLLSVPSENTDLIFGIRARVAF